MSAQWYYAKDNDRHGPISSGELKQLARDGVLKPTDLVWKEGMPDWQPASRVKDLFGDVPQTAPPTPSPVAPAATQADTTHTPDIGTAARGFFDAVTAKAKELAKRVTDKARQYRETLQTRANASSPQADAESAADASAGDADTRSSTRKPIPKWAIWMVGGGVVFLMAMCLLGVLITMFSGGSDLGISQEQFLRPTSTLDIESVMADSGVALTLKRENDDLRVWRAGKNNLLAVSGPAEKLTGVFLFCGYSADSTDNMTSTMLVMHAFGSTLNPHIGSGKKWSKGNELMKWTWSLFKSGKTEERSVNGKRVIVRDMFPLGFQLSILPKRGTVDPSDVLTEMMK